jgi:phage gpG-like protein
VKYFEGLGQFADFLEERAALHDEAIHVAAGASALTIFRKAQSIFGDASKLEELAPATQDERTRLGYSANEPLLRDGSLLKDRLEHGHEGMFAGVGSEEPVMAYHEYGYLNARTGNAVPPRPVLRIAMEESGPSVLAILEAVLGRSLSGSALTTLAE